MDFVLKCRGITVAIKSQTMSEQLTLFELPPPSVPKHSPSPKYLPLPSYSLFLAIFPDVCTAQRITEFGNALRREHGIHDRMRPISHLHVSLYSPDWSMDRPEIMAERIAHVCKVVTTDTRPFEINFNQKMSFRGRPGNHPLVLVDDNRGNDGIRELHASLYTEFTKYARSARAARKFVPHMTLLYSQKEIAQTTIEPLNWTVKEIVFIASEVGATRYHRLARWPLSV
jgi:2'-5' RNA ligase